MFVISLSENENRNVISKHTLKGKVRTRWNRHKSWRKVKNSKRIAWIEL